MQNLLLLNGLKPVDVGFFIAVAVIIALIVAVYFLIPVFNKKQYREQRENLARRENAFKSNKKTTVGLEVDGTAEVPDAVMEESGDNSAAEIKEGNE